MRPHSGFWLAVVLCLTGAGAAIATVPPSADASVVGTVSAAEHELEEGYFTMGEEIAVVARPGSELHRWLSAHRGQKVRLAVSATLDGRGDPSSRPGTGRDSAP